MTKQQQKNMTLEERRTLRRISHEIDLKQLQRAARPQIVFSSAEEVRDAYNMPPGIFAQFIRAVPKDANNLPLFEEEFIDAWVERLPRTN